MRLLDLLTRPFRGRADNKLDARTGQLDTKITALLQLLQDQASSPKDQAPSAPRAIYESVMKRRLSHAEEYFTLVSALTALDGPEEGATRLSELIGRNYVQRMRHDEMTGDCIGATPERFAAPLVSEYRQAVASGAIRANDLREFLCSRCLRFKTLTDLQQAVVLARMMGADALAVKVEAAVQRTISGLR